MVIVPFVSFRKGIPPGSTSNRLEAWSPPFQLRPFPSTDPIALTPTALPPRPTRAADEIGAESWKELKALSTYESTKYICLWKKSSLFCNRFSTSLREVRAIFPCLEPVPVMRWLFPYSFHSQSLSAYRSPCGSSLLFSRPLQLSQLSSFGS